MVALLHGTDSIRDVIAFPKTASGGDPLTGAPAPVDERQLRELGLQLRAQAPARRLVAGSPGPASSGSAALRVAPRARAVPVHVGDPRFDDWDVVRDFGDVRTARALRQALRRPGSSRR